MITFANKLIPYRAMFFYLAFFLFAAAFFIVLGAVVAKLIRDSRERREKQQLDELLNLVAEQKEDRTSVMRQIAAPDGVNPNVCNYLILSDAGQECYIRCFTIAKMPKRSAFAKTFSPLLNFPNVTSSIFVEPMTEGESSRLLDKHVIILDSESQSAAEKGDRNRYRKLLQKMGETESWASDIEQGENKFFRVGFGFALSAKTLNELASATDAFVFAAREKGMEVSACYGVHPEAYQSMSCLNSIFSLDGYVGHSTPIKRFLMDRMSLSTIFNYSQNALTHRNGYYIGTNMSDGTSAFFDPFDRSHNGYNVIISGMVGSGKSTLTKIMAFRMCRDIRFVAVDSQRPPGLNEGEYCALARAVNGVVFTILPHGSNILNIFEVTTTKNVDIDTNWKVQDEYETLELKNKISDVVNIVMMMSLGSGQYGITAPPYQDVVFMQDAATKIANDLYESRGIYDGNPDSLYEYPDTSGERRKKELPTFTDFYKQLLLMEHREDQPNRKDVYRTMVAALREYVRELYYSEKTLKFYSRAEYEMMAERTDGFHYVTAEVDGEEIQDRVIAIQGIRSYFDGQSTVTVSPDTRFTNIDLSGLPEAELNVARMVTMSFINERFVNRNSADPRKVERLVVVLDEVHKMWSSDYCRKLIAQLYRTVRKRECGCWAITQSLTDFRDSDEEAKTMFENTSAMFLFKHNFSAKEFLKSKINITESQMYSLVDLGGNANDSPEMVNARRGEVCIVDSDHLYFVKIRYIPEVEGIIAETDAEKRRQRTIQAG